MANWIDRAIGYVAPQRGAQRAIARAQIESVNSIRAMYDGAARGGRVGYRAIGGSSANSEIYRSLARLRDVSRDLDRNNSMAASCRAAWKTNIIGAGIIPAITARNKRLKLSLQDVVKDHLDTTAIDFDGRSTFYGLQALMVDALVRDGEVLVVRYTPPAGLRLPVPVQARVLEIDYLDGTKQGPVDSGGVCFDGIEFDAAGRRVAYWLYDEHPGGGVTWRYPTSRRVPARDVAHLYRVDRPGQARGVPWCAPVIVSMWDLHDYQDAELLRQKIAACFAVFLTGDPGKNLADKISSTDKSTVGTPLETVEPGMIYRLGAGQEVKFASPPITQGFKDFTIVYDRKICAGYGVPYEIATGDLSNVSFISGRLGLLQFGRGIDQARWHIVIPHGCASIGRWFLDAAAIALTRGSIEARFDWSPPRRELVDPKSEIPAIKDAIRAGLSSRSEENRKSGYDPEDLEQELADENARADLLKLRFDSDGRFPVNTRGTEVIPTEQPSPADPNAPDDPGAAPEN